MRVDQFDFDLPESLIAIRPAQPRENARLLVDHGTGPFEDRRVGELVQMLKAGDVLVFNDTKVIPAQLSGRRGDAEQGARIGATLHKRLGPRSWQAFIKNAKRLKEGDRIFFGHGVEAIAAERFADGSFALSFTGEEPVEVLIERAGQMPLPPYIASKRPTDARDAQDYQTMFAAKKGAVAAPTASLHFTQDLIDRLDQAGIQREMLTLHVGAGTFMPVKADDTDDHQMHSEIGELDSVTAARLNQAKAEGRRIIAIGTTSLRLLESSINEAGQFAPFQGETDIFITPGYRFAAIDGLMTNFHLPRSTLFMLVSALMGVERMRENYAHAIAEKYRFYSYGDASLLLP